MDFNLKSMIRSVNSTWPTSSLQPTPRVVIGYGISRVDIVGFYLALSAVEVAKKHRRPSHKTWACISQTSPVGTARSPL